MCEYPGRSCRRIKKTYSEKKCVVTTNCKKSAEAIVPRGKKTREGLNNRKSLLNEQRRST